MKHGDWSNMQKGCTLDSFEVFAVGPSLPDNLDSSMLCHAVHVDNSIEVFTGSVTRLRVVIDQRAESLKHYASGAMENEYCPRKTWTVLSSKQVCNPTKVGFHRKPASHL